MKAIETVYKGYRFRSRLEARWAVFFDALGIKWQYEVEGFEFEDGTRYLPDFYLPTFSEGMFVEVGPEDKCFRKAYQLAAESLRRVWIAKGDPTFRTYDVIECEAPPTCKDPESCTKKKIWSDDDFFGPTYDCRGCKHQGLIWRSIPGIPNFDQAQNEDRMFWQPGYENVDGTLDEEYWKGTNLESAVLAARQARFEHGENGAGHGAGVLTRAST